MVKEGDQFKFSPADGVDVLKVAQNVQKPTSEMCLRCHAGPGGGPNHKHGVTPTKDSDVHMAKGMACIDCHTTKQHKIAGGSDIKAQELLEVKVACSNCHTEFPHKGSQAAILNKHNERIACQTCHIPAIARDPKMPTVVERDWTKPVLNEYFQPFLESIETGLYGPSNKMANNVKPEYRWWNRMMLVPPEPVGSISDSKAKIYPWKRTTYTVIGDAATDKVVFIKAGIYSITGDVAMAAKKGAEDGKQTYSGQWKGVAESMVFSLNHQVAPKSEALKCNACHSPAGIMDFKTLGYEGQVVKRLTTNR